IAHDFNNLLQVIAGNLQLLQVDVAAHKGAQRRVASALAGVNRGAKLASQLLAFARRQPLAPKVVNIRRHLLGIEDMLRRSLGESIEIETVLPDDLWNTFADLSQIENAVLNLAINARDAMGGVGKLTIELANARLDAGYVAQHPDLKPGPYVMLAVSDTGSGMPAEVIERAFEPFFSTKPEGKGTGLGLSMVYGFAKQSGGHVMIYSELGLGTTVKLYLPRSTAPEEALQAPDTTAAEGGTETILVAEDDEQVRKTVVDTLEALGYRVLRAPDAATALAIIESGVHVDLLFTDVVMPGSLRSPELARRATELLPDLAVLFTSGYTQNAIVHGGRLDPGVELLSKPYRQEDLARKLRQVLGRKERGARADPLEQPPQRSGRFMLLVDDDQETRQITAELLAIAGHEVLQAGTVAGALALLAEQPGIEVLVTDLSLPDGSGEALVARVREQRPTLAVVFASGKRPDALPANSVSVLKPFGTEELERALAQLFG
ncbi:MAG TPA: response regulator, partial [Ramlibacter sp.]